LEVCRRYFSFANKNFLLKFAASMNESFVFAEPAVRRLEKFLAASNDANAPIVPLTPDASAREYFRVGWRGRPAVACVYPEKFAVAEQSYLDVSRLFLAAGLPVAEVYAWSEEFGVIVHEDFGDRILRTELAQETNAAERERLLNEAIALIAKIQAATPLAFELDSVASRLAFDFEKLSWELDFFTKHYFDSLRGGGILSETERADLKIELDAVAKELEKRIAVLTHRDFHTANLMIDHENRLQIIDHQDARMGAASYDLVSLLLDRIEKMPEADWICAKQRLFLQEREKLNLPPVSLEDFATEFRWQTVQRCLKAIGTFSYQTAVRGKTVYAQYINPMFAAVLQAAAELNRFPVLQRIIKEKIQK
jgi:aminoglycoside/choline kinase family phosphotransferase